MYPLGDLDPLARLRQQNPYLQFGQRPERPQIQPLAPDEEQSMLSRIGQTALGGVGYVGDVLEKTFGGRAVRGLLGGKPRELMSVLPGSDLVGLTDPAQKVTGKELLGFKPDDDSWGATLAGMGTEMALDPGMYLTFGSGALTGAGKAAKAAGLLPKTLTGLATTTLSHALTGAAPEALDAATRTLGKAGTSLAAEGGNYLGGVVGLGLPFMDPAVVLGANPGGAKFVQGLGSAARAADTAARSVPLLSNMTYVPVADAVKHGYDFASRYGKALFDPTVMGATTHEGQAAATQAHGEAAKFVAHARGRIAGYADQLRELGYGGGRGEELRSLLENRASALDPNVRSIVDALHGDLKSTEQRLNQLGVPVAHWVDPMDRTLGYFPRYEAKLAKPSGGVMGLNAQPIKAVSDVVQTSREPILTGFAGGTEGVNRAALDPLIHQGSRGEAAQHLIEQGYLTPPSQLNVSAPPPMTGKAATTPEQAAAHTAAEIANAQRAQQAQALKFVDWARGQDPARLANNLPFFGNHPLVDLERHMEGASKLVGAGEAGQSLLARTAQPIQGTLAKGSVPLNEVLGQVGLDSYGGAGTLRQRLEQQLGQTLTPAQLADYAAPASSINEIKRYMSGFQAPESVNPLLRGFDAFTNFTKGLQTALWPAFHVRNRVSGAIQNIQEGGLGTLFQGKNAAALMRGEAIPGIAERMGMAGASDLEVTRQLGREQYAYGIGGHTPHAASEISGPGGPVYAGSTLEDYMTRIPGRTEKTWTGAAQRAVDFSQPGSMNPLNVSGVGANADIFSPLAGGRQVGDMVEGVNRGSLYLSLREQGMSAEQAANRVLASHFDYTPGATTQFEKTWMKRLMPYYSFSRGNLPYQLEQLATRPNSLAGVIARGAGDLRQQGGFIPDYLGNGLAIPLGGEDPATGTKRYLTRLDTPVEQAFEWLSGGPRGGERTLMGALGQLNPLIKGPLELATERQFYTGRELPDLYSFTGNVPLDQAIVNSPVSRFFTTAKTLSDPAKWHDPYAIPTNLLTGARVTDVDLNKFKTIAEREYVEQNLRGLPEISKFQTLSVRPGMEGSLSPEEWQLLRLNKTIEARAQQRAKARR